MYLKSIEVHGFKSFANKMVFEFHDGITAIVGPNGSGKSNVGDAVRWVLGEQSAKQLRGSKMEDVIFSGTEMRKPLGFAYVAITLDNSDHKLPTSYEEVTVARRVYRSGESEYLINGSNCRLKDVQELFLDTGIGKEGYSIIGQGQIDKILSGKPEERRELFDEAAGIVKFKKRKAAAEKNLEAEQQNLCRIKDILSELEKQVGPLEKQSQAAKEYLKLRDELKSFEVNMFLLEYDKLHGDISELEKKEQIVTEDLEETKTNYDKAKEEYEKLEEKLEKENEKIEELRNLENEEKLAKQRLEGDIKVCQEQITAAKQNDAHYRERVTAVEKSIIEKKQELEEYGKEIAEFEHKFQALENRKKNSEAELQKIQEEIGSFGKNIDSYNKEIFGYLSVSSNLKSKLQKFETMLEQTNLKKAELTQKVLKQKTNEAECQKNLEEENTHLSEITQKIENLEAEKYKNETQLSELRKRGETLQSQWNEKQQMYHKEHSRLESLKNITERYEGYGQSIRRVMEQKEKQSGIIGVVADIIKVKKEYETAVETALGGSIQNIVTDNENTAKNLIAFLKKNKYGRATFLPLTNMKNYRAFQQETVLSENGVIGLASSLIETEDRFRDLIVNLLGRIVVVDTIDHAIAVAKKYRNTLRIVTLEGELLSPGGSMSGGAFKNASNLLSRRREIEELEKTLVNLKERLTELKKNYETTKSHANEYGQKLQVEQEELQKLYLIQNTSKLRCNQLNREMNEIAENYNEITVENMAIEKDVAELKQNIDDLNRQIVENDNKSKANEDKIADVNRQLEAKKREEDSFREDASKVSLDFSMLEQRKEFLKENTDRSRQELERLGQEQETLKISVKDAAKQVEEKEREIVEMKQGILQKEERIASMEENMLEMLQKKQEISTEHKSFFDKREELSNRINHLDKEAFRLTSQREKLSEQISNKVNYMWEEYELTYNGAYQLKTDHAYELSEMKRLVGDLKGRIKSLGDVNVNAIEDYKMISERYELLTTQHDDLIESEEVLREIIEELDQEMRKQFEEKFGEIQKEFDVVFKELFGGGKGELELVDGEDILEAGIRIIAQPPGKKLQNMMQLSGGEKALAAIALMFAIQNLKPSPFCLLDEIEAALDDSNVKRYAEYLHKLTEHTQFIVITHRRGTMAAADILYGITMQEKGVSTMVSVNLIEDQLEK